MYRRLLGLTEAGDGRVLVLNGGAPDVAGEGGHGADRVADQPLQRVDVVRAVEDQLAPGRLAGDVFPA